MSGAHVLVAIPYEPARSPVWPEKARALAERLPEANPGISFELALHPTERTHEEGDGRFSPHARARNSLLDACLRPEHTHVLWLDSDLLSYPADLPTRLLTLAPEGMAAPAALLDEPGTPNRFYDILGFIENGKGARIHQPWFKQAGPVIELDSVGCAYLAHADIYRAGARYAHTPGYTEHWAVCAAAKAEGRRICADLSLVALHAWLPHYGEALH
jgi:hypothetical protein